MREISDSAKLMHECAIAWMWKCSNKL